jgi:thiamine-monophosphate kinase
VLGLTAIGRAGSRVPHRAGAKPGDVLWLVATVGDAAAGLAQLRADRRATGPLVDIFRRPVPQLEAGRALAPFAHAMMDVSDGLLLDASRLAQLQADSRATGVLVDIYRRPVPQLVAGQVVAPHAHAMMDVSDGLLLDTSRLAQASRCSAAIALDALPLSSAYVAERGQDLASRLFAATGGDDYALLAALPPDFDPSTLPLPRGTRIARIGALASRGAPLRLTFAGDAVALPERLGFEHVGTDDRGVSAAPMAHRP